MIFFPLASLKTLEIQMYSFVFLPRQVKKYKTILFYVLAFLPRQTKKIYDNTAEYKSIFNEMVYNLCLKA